MTLHQHLIVETGIGRRELSRIILTAPSRYKRYPIPKRQGGARIIAQPAAELKILQRVLLDRLTDHLPVHECATAYVRGRNIRHNAQAHRMSRAILKLDFNDFFHSITAADWNQFLNALGADALVKVGLESEEDKYIATRLLFWGKGTNQPKCLSIGAPTSPAISNLLLFQLDTDVSAAMNGAGVRYTRYADDITLSGNSLSDLRAAEAIVREIVRSQRFPTLTFNDKKRGAFTSGQKRMVTGVIITPDRKLSLGRDRKREIHALVHRFSLGQLIEDEVARLKGLIGFANAVEPEFLSRIRAKYGDSALDGILKFHVRRRAARQGYHPPVFRPGEVET